MMNEAWLEERKSDLLKRREEFAERISRIKKDIGRGLPADSKEQVIQLENQEVLDALGKEAAEELRRIESALRKLGHRCRNENTRRRNRSRNKDAFGCLCPLHH